MEFQKRWERTNTELREKLGKNSSTVKDIFFLECQVSLLRVKSNKMIKFCFWKVQNICIAFIFQNDKIGDSKRIKLVKRWTER